MTNMEALQLFEKTVDRRAAEVDPNDLRDWDDLAYGFFLALGFSPDVAEDLAVDAVCGHDWQTTVILP